MLGSIAHLITSLQVASAYRSPWIIAFMAVVCAVASPDSIGQVPPQQKRIGLVIANQHYANPKDVLTRPIEDASKVGAALRELRFEGIEGSEPTIVVNASKAKLEEVVLQFEKRVKAAGSSAIGFIYYAGHAAVDKVGLVSDNYLVPVEVNDIATADIAKRGVGLRWITERLASLQSVNGAVVIVMDACRTPLGGGEATERGSPNSSTSIPYTGQLMVPDEPKEGFLVAFSTAVNRPASDNGIYADTLAEKLRSTGLSITAVFEHVQQAVAAKTNQRQVPFYKPKIVAEKLCFIACQDQVVSDQLARLECANLKPDDLVLLVRARDLARTLSTLKCRKEFLLVERVQYAFASMLGAKTFEVNREFAEQLRRQGMNFLIDIVPEDPDDTDDYRSTPLGFAFREKSVSALNWLLQGANQDQIRRLYPRILETQLPPIQRTAYVSNADMQLFLEAYSMLIKSGATFDRNSYQLFKWFYARWVELEFQWDVDRLRTVSPATEERKQQLRAQAHFWKTISSLVSPKDAPSRNVTQQSVMEQFFKPRLDTANGRLKLYRFALTKPGMRILPDKNGFAGLMMGGPRVQIPNAQLTDSDFVQGPRLGMMDIINPEDWITVAAARQEIQKLQAEVAQLDASRDRLQKGLSQ